ncbi:FG-GAP repeat domain-containing protein [Microbacterium azadirachtae]|uniref:FG-GAP repeat domain-containing protein n=1 Tax=Microbacterium azadirachtae TaxID=582680 RepID=UPI00111363F2|nr:VCBS repeat-containing protein [Microbacterium azadirachtae]
MTGHAPGPVRAAVPRRRMIGMLVIAAVLLSVLAPAIAGGPPASAVQTSLASSATTSVRPMTLDGWNAGNIISDAVFTNKTTMSADQIQSFFNAKVVSCQAGYTCLKDFRVTSQDRPADAYCRGYSGTANESAASIIYRVSQSCNINPQVLIVMLQKEQGLVTHTWPSSWRYDSALGQGCPDDAPCDPTYVGFFQQIYGAARQMQIYMEGRWFTWYAPGNTWNILYNPNQGCGSGPVYIANKATAALYYYTPYQPNAAALRAGYGEGDSCSAYGNRNFYNYFTDWFGSTQTSTPAQPPVTLQPINTSGHVLAVNAAGQLLAYPFKNVTWGAPIQVGSGFAGRKVFGVGDLTGDGNRDAIDVRSDGTVDVISGTGTGYDAVRTLPVNWSGAALIAPAGDFDGDGIPDMFTTRADGTLLLWRGTAQGGLREGIPVGSGWQGFTALVGGVDFSGDGVPDLIGRTSGGSLVVYFGNGRGGWAGQRVVGSGWNGMSAIFSPGDFGADGTADLLARDGQGRLLLYAGLGGGAFSSGTIVGGGWDVMTSLSGPGTPATKARALPAGAGDLNGDGAADVVALTSAGALTVYRGNGTGGWGAVSYARTDWAGQARLIPLGDFTGDGFRDVGSVDASGTFRLWKGDGAGGFADPIVIGSGWDPKQVIVGSMDFDGDGNTDVLMRNSAGDLLLYRGNGAGGWITGRGERIGSGWGVFDAVFYAGDFDGDRRGDLIARRADGSLWLYGTDGAGSWVSAKQIGTGWSIMTAVFSTGDFDGDGAADVIARLPDGGLMLYRGDGAGGWKGSTIIGSGWSVFSQIG